jgi:serine/threonine protein kinase
MPSTVVGPGHVIAGRYRIERWLGQGGMGSVYRALQLSVQRMVALKRLVDEHLESPSHVERFEREALALSRLSHQSTVRLFDFGSDERGCPFIVMEYLEGSDLAADLERHGPMRWDQALSVASQILGSLAEAHAAGIIHRDIKPANLFLCATGEWPVVKVLDFGIAGGAEPRGGLPKLTLAGTVLGSGPYMSPEQAQGLPVSPAADLYSLGVVLFEMLTGRTPFEPRTLTAQLIAKVLEVAPRLRDVCPEVQAPSEVQALVASLLERDPAERPPSARATAERIQALLAGSALPSLPRPARRADASSAPIAKTEPMRVPHTIDEGWTPPKTEAPPPSTRSRGAVAWSLLLAAASTTAAAGLWRALPRPPRAPATESALAALGALPPSSSNEEPQEREGLGAALDAGIGSVSLTDGASAVEHLPPSPRALPVALAQPPLPVATQPPAARATNAAKPRPRTSSSHPSGPRRPARQRAEPAAGAEPSGPPSPFEGSSAASPPAAATAAASPSASAASASTTPPSTPAPPLEPAAPVTPDTLVLPGAVTSPETPAEAPGAQPPGAQPERQPPQPQRLEPQSTTPAPSLQERPEPALGAPVLDPRYWTIAAARAAAGRGDITPAQRNEIILGLQQRRLQARARAARAYREGRIGFEALLHRQRAIERRIEGW